MHNHANCNACGALRLTDDLRAFGPKRRSIWVCRDKGECVAMGFTWLNDGRENGRT